MKIVFASNNKHKIEEIQAMLPKHIEIVSLQAIGCNDDIPETADTIEGNAILKANYVSANYNCDCFADDTGLEVEALNGKPGVHSARYAGEERDAEKNTDKLLLALSQSDNRRAQFKTVIAVNLHGEQHLFTGIVKGEITMEKRGNGGFGYDPIFKANGQTKTFAELTLKEKAEIGHRGEAVRKLVEFLSKVQ
ncbi:MAG TPA: non-canonical purine NTP diphosphatase [Flavobacterium sp.]